MYLYKMKLVCSNTHKITLGNNDMLTVTELARRVLQPSWVLGGRSKEQSARGQP